MATRSKLSGNLVRLSAPSGTKLEARQVHEAIDQILKLHGCLGCGLIGIDIHINGPDPDPLNIAGFDAQVR